MNYSAIATLIVAFFISIPIMALAQSNNSFAVQTTIKQGRIEGFYDTGSGVQHYKGIPYARPPVGDLRWKAPQPLEPWQEVKLTKNFGPRAIQAPVFGDMNFRSNGMSEDCLYLNVWTPATRNTTGLPVLVYFYGGGFVAGDGSEPRYDGESMAKEGIVTVTVNYRLNIFGFLSHPELSKEAPYQASGNYGLLDQVAALEWVRENIEAFGGDPGKVTIAGESAGSISVSSHMASPLSRKLISGAIGESGAAIHPTMVPIPLVDAEAQGVEFVEKAGFDDFNHFRNLSTREIYEIYTESRRFGFPSVIDGYFMPASLPEIFGAGKQAQVPLLLGWNSAEIPAGAFMYGMPNTEENFESRVKAEYPDDYETVMALYPHSNEEEIIVSATALASDRFISYSTWKWFELHSSNSDQPVFRYLYSKLRPPIKNENLVAGLAGGTMNRQDAPPQPKVVGAPHACEIEYCMGNLHLVDDFSWTEEDYIVSKTMMTYFANFVKTGDPNGEELAEWPVADASEAKPSVMIIDVESKAIQSEVDDRYRFHDSHYQK